MLEFAESVLDKIRRLRRETHDLIVSGTVRDMEQYRYLLGRLEGYDFLESEVKSLLSKQTEYLS